MRRARRARLLARTATARLRWRAAGWAAAVLPTLPLFALPLPAFPVYYVLWKAYSARAALAGARALQADLAAGEEDKGAPLDLIARGVAADAALPPPPPSLDAPTPLTYVASDVLDALGEPSARLATPLPPAAAAALARALPAPGLEDAAARGRRRWVGAAFPSAAGPVGG